MVEETNRHIRIGVGLKELAQLSDIPTDTAMGVRLKSWIESAQIETNGYHAP
jgi:hypothetical protein